MIFSLFKARFRVKNLLAWLLPAFLLGALAVFLYSESPLAQARLLREELPEVFTVLGFYGDSSLPVFVLGALYGFVLPLVLIGLGIHQAARQVVRPTLDGRMAMLLAADHRRGAILLTLWWVLATSGFLAVLAAFLGQVLMLLILFPGADIRALARLAGGFMAVSLICPAFALLMAVLGPDERAMRRRSALALYGSLVLAMASRLPGWPRLLRFASFWSLFDGTGLVFGGPAWQPLLPALGLTAVLIALSLLSFSGREV